MRPLSPLRPVRIGALGAVFVSAGLTLVLAVLALVLAVPAGAAVGSLGGYMCYAEDPGSGSDELASCHDGRGLSSANSVAVSPDGKNVYIASSLGGYGAVTVFDRDGTGYLLQKTGAQGCIVENPAASAEVNDCADGVALSSAQSVTVSPAGRQVYVASLHGLAIFDRNTSTGELTQKPGSAGCIVDDNTVAAVNVCADGEALAYAGSAAIPPDGKNVYVTSYDGDSLAVLNRNPANGVITQSTGTDGCISETGAGPCTDGRALYRATSVTVSPDGNGISVYVSSGQGGRSAVAVFDRDAGTGALSQKAGAAGCVAEDNSVPEVNTCTDGRALEGASSVATSLADEGRSLYVAAEGSNAVAVFDRSTTTGELTQKPAGAGCIADRYPDFPNPETATCTDGHTLGLASGVTVSPDDRTVYVTNYLGAVLTFDRDKGGDLGTLTQGTGLDSCTTVDGTSLHPYNSPGACRDGNALFGASSLALSSDGANAYLAAELDSAIATFKRELPDVTPPDTVILSGPSGDTSSTDATFRFVSSERSSTFECRLGLFGTPGAWSACSSPQKYSVPDGRYHEFSVRATDSSANTDPTPARRVFRVDSFCDGMRLVIGPSGEELNEYNRNVRDVTNDPNPAFTWRAGDCQPYQLIRNFDYQCAVVSYSLSRRGYSTANRTMEQIIAPASAEGGAEGICSVSKFHAREGLDDGSWYMIAGGDNPFGTDRRIFIIDTKLRAATGVSWLKKRIAVLVAIKAKENLAARARGEIVWGRRKISLEPGRTDIVVPFRSGTEAVATRASEKLKLVPKRTSDKKKVLKALKQGKKLRAKVKVRLSDEVGNKETDKLKLKLKR